MVRLRSYGRSRPGEDLAAKWGLPTSLPVRYRHSRDGQRAAAHHSVRPGHQHFQREDIHIPLVLVSSELLQHDYQLASGIYY